MIFLLLVWIKALTFAARGDGIMPVVDYSKLYNILGLQSNDNPSASDINRAYRKAALKVHPDKGGDIVEVFKLNNVIVV